MRITRRGSHKRYEFVAFNSCKYGFDHSLVGKIVVEAATEEIEFHHLEIYVAMGRFLCDEVGDVAASSRPRKTIKHFSFRQSNCGDR